MNLNITDIMILAGASQGIFLSILLLLNKQNRLINSSLIISILIISLGLFNDLFFRTGVVLEYISLAYILEPFNMLFGVCIFIYIRNKIDGKFTWKKSDYLMLIPFVIYSLYYSSFYLLEYQEKYNQVLLFVDSGNAFAENAWEWILESIVNTAFLLMSLRLIVTKGKSHNISQLSIISLITYALLTIYTFETIVSISLICNVQIPDALNYFVYTLLVVLLFGFGYNELIASTIESKKATTKYNNSALSSSDLNKFSLLLDSLMKEKKPYLESDISIKKLSDLMGLQPYIVSQVINEGRKCNFSEFINSYRVEEAKQLLRNPDYKNYTLTAIGFESGFNSKTAFYTTFKRFTGTTPAKY